MGESEAPRSALRISFFDAIVTVRGGSFDVEEDLTIYVVGVEFGHIPNAKPINTVKKAVILWSDKLLPFSI